MFKDILSDFVTTKINIFSLIICFNVIKLFFKNEFITNIDNFWFKVFWRNFKDFWIFESQVIWSVRLLFLNFEFWILICYHLLNLLDFFFIFLFPICLFSLDCASNKLIHHYCNNIKWQPRYKIFNVFMFEEHWIAFQICLPHKQYH